MQCLHNDVKGVQMTTSTAVQPSFTCYTAKLPSLTLIHLLHTSIHQKFCQPGLCCWCSSNKSLHSVLHHEFAKMVNWVNDLNQIRRKAEERNKQVVCLPSHWVASTRCIIWDICANGIRILQCCDWGVIILDLMIQWDRHWLLWHALTACIWSIFMAAWPQQLQHPTFAPRKSGYLHPRLQRNGAELAKVEAWSNLRSVSWSCFWIVWVGTKHRADSAAINPGGKKGGKMR